jgi:hypothetical protein
MKITALLHFVGRSTHTKFFTPSGKIRFLIQLFIIFDAASIGCVVFVCHMILVVFREVI